SCSMRCGHSEARRKHGGRMATRIGWPRSVRNSANERWIIVLSWPRAAPYSRPVASRVSRPFCVLAVAHEKLANVLGKPLTVVTAACAPGGKSVRHRHAGSAFAYVLSGAIRSRSPRLTTFDRRPVVDAELHSLGSRRPTLADLAPGCWWGR